MSEVVTTHESPVIPAEVLGAFVMSAARLDPEGAILPADVEQRHAMLTTAGQDPQPIAAVLDRETIRIFCTDKSLSLPLLPGHLSQIIDDVQASTLLAVKHRISNRPEAATVVTSVSLLGGPGRTPRPLLGFLVESYADGRIADSGTEAFIPSRKPLRLHWPPPPKLASSEDMRVDNLNSVKPLLKQHILYDPLRAVRGVTTLVDAVLLREQAAA